MDGNGCGNVGGEVVQLSVLIEAEHFYGVDTACPSESSLLLETQTSDLGWDACVWP